MSLTDSYIHIPVEKSVMGIYAEKCNHTLTKVEFGYILTDNKTGKRYDFDKVIMRFPEDITKQISENYNKHKEEDRLQREHKQRTEEILFEPDYHKRRKLLSKRYIKENLK